MPRQDDAPADAHMRESIAVDLTSEVTFTDATEISARPNRGENACRFSRLRFACCIHNHEYSTNVLSFQERLE